MTERPYTDADLRDVAVRLHADLTEDPDFTSVGEAMCDRVVPSTVVDPNDGATGITWENLLPYDSGDGEYEEYSTAQTKIHDLIRGAADVSQWAINLGADGLEPSPDTLGVEAEGSIPAVRVHFAFHSGTDDAARREFTLALMEFMAGLGQSEATTEITAEVAAHVLWDENREGYPPGDFITRLLAAWREADNGNRGRLAAAFPEYGAALELLGTRTGLGVLRAIATG